MALLRAVVLGIVQGAAEFLPISSSGHLVLVPWLLNWPGPGLVFDAMVHWGTLVAVTTYFREDLWALARAWLASLQDRSLHPSASTLRPTHTEPRKRTGLGEYAQRRLAWLILIGSIPAGLAGILFEDFFEGLFSRPGWAAAFLLVTGLLLVASEQWHYHRSVKRKGAASGLGTSKSGEDDLPLAAPLQASPPLAAPLQASSHFTWSLSLAGALLIGVAQALAIAPGISRAGATIAAGLFVGLDRRDSARFSFLLSVPAILGAGAFQLLDLASSTAASSQIPVLVVGFVTAGATGYLAIRFLLDFLQRHSLNVFAAYCWGVGLLGLTVYWLR